jgi:hypothetical protein
MRKSPIATPSTTSPSGNSPIPESNEKFNGDYPVPDPEALCRESSDLNVCFSGILHHIFVNSGNRYNIQEIKLTYKTL